MVGVFYWTGSGFTEEMATFVAEGLDKAGKPFIMKRVEEITPAEALEQCEAFAFGCPAMGAEVLEETVFEPWFEEIEKGLSGKKVALFGSYGWGTGEWMDNWSARVKEDGAELVDTVIAQAAADDDAKAVLQNFAAKL